MSQPLRPATIENIQTCARHIMMLGVDPTTGELIPNAYSLSDREGAPQSEQIRSRIESVHHVLGARNTHRLRVNLVCISYLLRRLDMARVTPALLSALIDSYLCSEPGVDVGQVVRLAHAVGWTHYELLRWASHSGLAAVRRELFDTTPGPSHAQLLRMCPGISDLITSEFPPEAILCSPAGVVNIAQINNRIETVRALSGMPAINPLVVIACLGRLMYHPSLYYANISPLVDSHLVQPGADMRGVVQLLCDMCWRPVQIQRWAVNSQSSDVVHAVFVPRISPPILGLRRM